MNSPDIDATPRKPYERPAVAVYGDLRLLTLNNTSNNMNDKGNGSFSMT
ncbi:MAG: hypothetical protein JWM27_525 [Gemmatimonadetes bacterium]|nr:hypothetical protein [Gemmatimonadota bacterium]